LGAFAKTGCPPKSVSNGPVSIVVVSAMITSIVKMRGVVADIKRNEFHESSRVHQCAVGFALYMFQVQLHSTGEHKQAHTDLAQKSKRAQRVLGKDKRK
jgi:hypothetical protein